MELAETPVNALARGAERTANERESIVSKSATESETTVNSLVPVEDNESELAVNSLNSIVPGDSPSSTTSNSLASSQVTSQEQEDPQLLDNTFTLMLLNWNLHPFLLPTVDGQEVNVRKSSIR